MEVQNHSLENSSSYSGINMASIENYLFRSKAYKPVGATLLFVIVSFIYFWMYWVFTVAQQAFL